MTPAVGCAPATRALDVDPIGTAGTYDRFVLVETPMPWPSDIGDHPLFAQVGKAPDARVLAVCGDRRGDGQILVTRWTRRSTNVLVGTDHLFAADVALAGIAALAAGAPSPATEIGPAPPEVLLCSHGKRDRCCGQFGTRLQQQVEHRWPGVRVRRCSHTGGHRFAPTGVTLPDGRLWAHLDEPLLDQIVTRSGMPSDLTAHDRGSTGLEAWAQPVERALLAHHGWAWLDAEVLEVSSTIDASGRGATVALTWQHPTGETRLTRGRVETRRDVPVPICGDPTAPPAKTSRELVLQALELDRPSQVDARTDHLGRHVQPPDPSRPEETR